jgi:3-dehydroquinate synthase
VGRRLAERLGWHFADLDAQIAAAAGKSVPDIFAQDGEPAFRALESEHLGQALAGDFAVVATGGGAVVSGTNRTLMRERAFVVCLEARPETIHARLVAHQAEDEEGAVRPLLADADPLRRIGALKVERQALYAEGDATIHTDALSEDEVAEEAHRHLARAGLAYSPGEGGGPVSVKTAAGYYHVHVGWETIQRLGELLRARHGQARAFLVSDDNAFAAHGEQAVASLEAAGVRVRHTLIPAGEASKSLRQAERLWQWLIAEGAERRDVVIALGGGVVGDLAGFAAATYLRGVPYVQVPTTLLSMVDSSVGGKTAVDHPSGKNLIGAFYPPSLVVADVATLRTLPPREVRSGWAEVIKHAWIKDPGLLAHLEAHAEALLALDPALMPSVVRRNVWIKARVVGADEREQGERVILNYGHTVGHALEAVSGFRLSHGEAVALGMVASADLAVRLGRLAPADAERQNALLRAFGLPTAVPAGLPADPAAVLAAMGRDKKVEAGSIRWVLAAGVGAVDVVRDVPEEAVRCTLEAMMR